MFAKARKSRKKNTAKNRFLRAFPFANRRLNILGLLCKVFEALQSNLEEEEEEFTMRRLTIFTAVALAAVSIGCDTAANTTTNKAANGANSNVAVVVNSSSNMAANTSSGTTTTTTTTSNSTTNYNVSRTDYDKDRAKYEAQKGASTIGSGANDSWIWFKTKGALAGVNDLRDSTVNVDVDNGVITLKGTVGTQAQKTAAEAAAKGIEGQKGIKNQLTVSADDSMTKQMTGTNSNTSNTNTKK